MAYRPILNSALQTLANSDAFNSYSKSFSDLTLKVGIVLKKYEIDDTNNISAIGPEYDVLAISQEKDMGTASVIYKKCQAIQGFGGIGDFVEYKLREPEKDPTKGDETDPRDENGSIVLLLCLHGSQDNGIIIGALQHPKRKSTLTKEKEQHLEGEFNGLNWQINKDGELVLTYKSATNNDGEPQNEEAGGTFLKIDKDGSVSVDTGEASEQILIDKPSKDIKVTAGNNVNVKAAKDGTLETGANLTATVGGDLVAEATGRAAITAGSNFEVEAASNVTIQGQSIDLKAANMAKVEGQMINLQGQTVFVGGQGGTPALTLTTQFLGTGNLGGPVISTAIGPFSSVVFIAP